MRGAEGGDPSAVIFDAIESAAAAGADLVLADTAGRLHTKVNLMEELRKVRRVAEKGAGTVTEVLLVLDATTGQNGLVQAQQFTEAVELTGVVLTKLDGSAKGGIVVAIQAELGIPVKLVGLGEGADDLVAVRSPTSSSRPCSPERPDLQSCSPAEALPHAIVASLFRLAFRLLLLPFKLVARRRRRSAPALGRRSASATRSVRRR